MTETKRAMIYMGKEKNPLTFAEWMETDIMRNPMPEFNKVTERESL